MAKNDEFRQRLIFTKCPFWSSSAEIWSRSSPTFFDSFRFGRSGASHVGIAAQLIRHETFLGASDRCSTLNSRYISTIYWSDSIWLCSNRRYETDVDGRNEQKSKLQLCDCERRREREGVNDNLSECGALFVTKHHYGGEGGRSSRDLKSANEFLLLPSCKNIDIDQRTIHRAIVYFWEELKKNHKSSRWTL